MRNFEALFVFITFGNPKNTNLHFVRPINKISGVLICLRSPCTKKDSVTVLYQLSPDF